MGKPTSPAVMPHNMTHFLRLADHLTLEDLRDRSGVSTNMLSRMEHGQFGSISTTKRVADALGVSMNTLVRNDYLALSTERPERILVSDCHRRQYRSQQAVKNEVGDAGEAYVLELERARLAGAPFAALVNGNYSEDFRAGFDIASFTENGEPLSIEVKSSLNTSPEPDFYITASELRFAIQAARNGWNYRLIYVYGMRAKNCEKWNCRSFTADEVLTLPLQVATFRVGKAVRA